MFEGAIDPLDLDFEVLIAEEFSPAARSARIADFAREQLAARRPPMRAALGFVPPHHDRRRRRRRHQ
jgi:cell division protein FtsL